MYTTGKDEDCYVFIGHDYTNKGGRVPKFRKAVADALKGSRFTPLYADDIDERHQAVLKDIIKKIKRSKFCVFDLTGYKEVSKLGKNLNVILELGISIGLDKLAFVAFKEGSIDFTKEMSDLLGDYRYPYKTYNGLKKDLTKYIASIKCAI